jgi:hypothetical protein
MAAVQSNQRMIPQAAHKMATPVRWKSPVSISDVEEASWRGNLSFNRVEQILSW